MRSLQIILISLVYLFTGLAGASALPDRDLRIRRDDPQLSSTETRPASGSGSDNFPALTTTTKPAPNSTNAPASPSTGGAATNGTTSSAPSATPTASLDPASEGAALPLEPQLTAPLAIGGVILLISGLVYTFIGIKSRNVQVFISTAYLISLGTTVLIVYVMTPPVSVGTQGAYLAAIVLPGLLLAAGAVVFKDVTEGLGCAVGGFALGMWFMTLKAGGLVDSQAGKIILLCCFTAVAFSISFSRYSRNYGLIGATAFAGATALMLGIDCFAKTGLKEFWLYIWGLNNNLFPLGTHTYPLTKNLKAEIAGIPIITLFGILSQIKVWKIVQTKRAIRAETEEQKKREKDDEEARLGKNLESRTQAEKLIWERTYADANRDAHSDSGIGSEPSNSEKGGSDKGSTRTSVSEREKADETVEVIELDDLGRKRHSKAARRLTPHIIVSVVEEENEEEEEQGIASPKTPMASSPKLPPFDFGYGQDHQGADTLSDERDASVTETEIHPALLESLKDKSLKPKTVPTPVVVPLPFDIPNGPPTPNEDKDDASSIATAATSVKRASKRFSTNSLFEKMTKGRLSWHARQSSDDSSVQAIADSPTRTCFDLSSLPGSRKASVDSPQAAIVASPGSKLSPSLTLQSQAESNPSSQPNSPRGDYFSSNPRSIQHEDHSGPVLSPGVLEQPAPESHNAEEGAALAVGGVSVAVKAERKLAPPALNLDSIKANTSSSSKVMNAFRTNEWAKHLEGAHEPENDHMPVSEPPSPFEPPTGASSAPEPVSEDERNHANLSVVTKSESSSNPPTPTFANSPPAEEQLSKASWPKPSSRRRTSTAAGAASQPSAEAKTAFNTSHRASREGRGSSQLGALRSSSGSRTRGGKARQPSQQALVTSPIQEDVEASFPPQAHRRLSLGLNPDSLLAQREAMMSQSSIVRSASQLSQHHSSGANHVVARASPVPSQGRPSSSLSRSSSKPEQFGMPQRQLSAASLRGSGQLYSPPTPVRTYSPINAAQTMTHDTAAPPPDRPMHYKTNAPDDTRRSKMLEQWRASLAGEQQQRRISQLDVNVEAGQGWLDTQRQQRQNEQYRHQAIGWGTEQVLSPTAPAHNPMQKQMATHEAHREVLRRMQSKSKVSK